jgi:hypothetical protein
MNGYRRIALWGLLALLVLPGVCADGLRAQPVRDRILSKVVASEDAGCTTVTVFLNFPVRYVRHFPYSSGDELRIRLDPIAISPGDREFLFRRESMRAPKNERAAISRLEFDGSGPEGPLLVFLFRRDVAFKVAQGSDYRSIVVAIAGPEPSESCTPHVTASD